MIKNVLPLIKFQKWFLEVAVSGKRIHLVSVILRYLAHDMTIWVAVLETRIVQSVFNGQRITLKTPNENINCEYVSQLSSFREPPCTEEEHEPKTRR